MCDIEYDDNCELFRQTTVTARKAYRCASCGAPIEPKAKYRRVFYVFEGTGQTERACLACAEIIDDFAKEHRFSPSPGSLGDMLSECIEGSERAESRRWERARAQIEARHKAANLVSP